MDIAALSFVMLVSGSPLGAPPELLWELAEGMSLVVAVDSGADWCLAAGLIPDLLIGDFDSISPATRNALVAQQVEELHFPEAKDATDLELALEELARRGYTDLVATNTLGGRLDHELAAIGNLSAAGRQGLSVTVVEPDQTLVFMNSPGARSRLKVGFGADAETIGQPTVSLIPWGGPATVSAKGFVWELDRATLLPESSLGISNLPNQAEPLIELFAGDLIVAIRTPAV